VRLLLGSGGLSTPERKNAWLKEIDSFLGAVKDILFIPYALRDHDGYTRGLNEWNFHFGRKATGIHRTPNQIEAVKNSKAISVGGGNTFRLLNDMYMNSLLEPIRERVRAGVPFIGVSAGSNVSGPTIKTTNDMPIVYPPSFTALGLVPFQINPHYFAGAIHIRNEDGSYIRYGGETRDDRIREFHEMNTTPVIGLWEGSILRVENGKSFLKGHEPKARLFRQGEPIKNFEGECELTEFLPRLS
jgi:dipeptidase E